MFARRVITAVLLLIATIVSPGVCDACPQSGCMRGAAASNSATQCPACTRTGTAAVADSGYHGTPFSGHPRGSMEAGDGPSNTCDSCRCMLAPRESEGAAAVEQGGFGGPVDVSLSAIVALPPLSTDLHRASRTDLFAGSLLPVRSARVLFGVWRN